MYFPLVAEQQNILHLSINAVTQRNMLKRRYNTRHLYQPQTSVFSLTQIFGNLVLSLPSQIVLSYKEEFCSHFLHFLESQRSSGVLNLPGSGLQILKTHYLLVTNYNLSG